MSNVRTEKAIPIAVAAVVVIVLLGVVGALPFGGGGKDQTAAAEVPEPSADRFDSEIAMALVRSQVKMGERPAGSGTSKRLARRIKAALPRGRYQKVPKGLRNVVGVIPGRSKRVVVIGAHYDTKDIDGFVGANDGAGGVAVLVQLARSIEKLDRKPKSTLVFIAFDGEESPEGTPDSQFEKKGLRGARVAAKRYRKAKAMVLLDFVGQRGLKLEREAASDKKLWASVRRAGREVGVGKVFPSSSQKAVADDHYPFLRRKVPAVDLIDFNYPCWHKTCDDMSKISERSLDAVGETMVRVAPRL